VTQYASCWWYMPTHLGLCSGMSAFVRKDCTEIAANDQGTNIILELRQTAQSVDSHGHTDGWSSAGFCKQGVPKRPCIPDLKI
jgi:hypothetical protein